MIRITDNFSVMNSKCLAVYRDRSADPWLREARHRKVAAHTKGSTGASCMYVRP